MKIGALLRVAVAQICSAGRGPLAYLDGCPCSASPVSAAGSGSAPQPNTPPASSAGRASVCLPRWGSGPLTAPSATELAGFKKTATLLICDLNPPAALLVEPPLPLRGIPPSGGIFPLTAPSGCRLHSSRQSPAPESFGKPKRRRSSKRPRTPVWGRARRAGGTYKGWRVGLDYKLK